MWYFEMTSDKYGNEWFGPYDTKQEAREGIDRVAEKCIELNDGVERHFTDPFDYDPWAGIKRG